MRVESSVLSVSWNPSVVQLRGPTGWTTLSLTIPADGHVEHQLTGASAFPRHWIYDASGTLSQESELMGGGAKPRTRKVKEGTTHAVTPCRVAVAAGDAIDKAATAELSEGHRREDPPPA